LVSRASISGVRALIVSLPEDAGTAAVDEDGVRVGGPEK